MTSSTPTFGDRAHQAISAHVEHILKYEEDVLGDRDPEALHQMRVGMRRLRSDTVGFAAAIELPKPARNRKIGKMARTLGVLRDIDVMQDLLQRQLLPNSPQKERDRLEPALKTLAKRRKAARKDTEELLRGKAYNKFKGAIQEWLQHPQYRPYADLPIRDVVADILLPSISGLLLEPGWWVGQSRPTESWAEADSSGSIETAKLTPEEVEALLLSQGKHLHNLRKQTKRVRYLMYLFTDLYSPTYQAYVSDMKELQEVLGNLQDSYVMAEFLSEALNQDFSKVAPELAQQLQRTRYQAWTEWQHLQSRYLSAPIRQVFRSEVVNGYQG
ncbi:CHAD domain-containing protein [Phormidium yuhuli AB48]|uniref:CHAD domain-containing protein n=1 Tax=Phormidium yuhuli AB48 TaxID=2940671 RepID=A0ABY5AP85_9CYAN|nr:CHAD domain-containing protein [Phormidium yuhuli]USR90069.1 CHAD domain-containing protein [Phormidium yuhuli AB48]